jgi:hypothetical protein
MTRPGDYPFLTLALPRRWVLVFDRRTETEILEETFKGTGNGKSPGFFASL